MHTIICICVLSPLRSVDLFYSLLFTCESWIICILCSNIFACVKYDWWVAANVQLINAFSSNYSYTYSMLPPKIEKFILVGCGWDLSARWTRFECGRPICVVEYTENGWNWPHGWTRAYGLSPRIYSIIWWVIYIIILDSIGWHTRERGEERKKNPIEKTNRWVASEGN